MNGWIKLHRKLLESNMYKNLNSKQRNVLFSCLLLANHSENEWTWGSEIYKCEEGEFVTSLENLSKLCGSDVKVQSVRTALLKLEKWHFLTNKSTKTGRLIKIINWSKYQYGDDDTDKDTNKEPTKSQQRANKEPTANNNDKNIKNDNNDNKYIDTNKLFFENYLENKIEILDKLKENKITISEKDLDQFFIYWSEKNKYGKKRWELEKTFEVHLRIIKWISNQSKWAKPEKKTYNL